MEHDLKNAPVRTIARMLKDAGEIFDASLPLQADTVQMFRGQLRVVERRIALDQYDLKQAQQKVAEVEKVISSREREAACLRLAISSLGGDPTPLSDEAAWKTDRP